MTGLLVSLFPHHSTAPSNFLNWFRRKIIFFNDEEACVDDERNCMGRRLSNYFIMMRMIWYVFLRMFKSSRWAHGLQMPDEDWRKKIRWLGNLKTNLTMRMLMYLMTKIRIIHSVGMRNQVNKHHLPRLDTFLLLTRKYKRRILRFKLIFSHSKLFPMQSSC